MKSRVAWGLVVVLVLSLIGGTAGMVAYGPQTGALEIYWHPISDWHYWWVGRGPLVVKACGPHGSTAWLIGERYSLGFVEVEVTNRGPGVVLYSSLKASARSGRER